MNDGSQENPPVLLLLSSSTGSLEVDWYMEPFLERVLGNKGLCTELVSEKPSDIESEPAPLTDIWWSTWSFNWLTSTRRTFKVVLRAETESLSSDLREATSLFGSFSLAVKVLRKEKKNNENEFIQGK